MKVSTICLSKFMTAWHEKQSLDTMDNLDANDQFFIVCRYSLQNGMWFHFSSLGVCCPVLGERFSCQRSTRDKPVADVYQFVALVKLNRKTDAESRLSWERKLLWLLCQPQNDWVLGLFQLLHCRAAAACEYEINMEDKSIDTAFSYSCLV